MMEVNIAKFIIVFDISLDNSYKKIVVKYIYFGVTT